MLIQKITLGHPKVWVKAQNCFSLRKKKIASRSEQEESVVAEVRDKVFFCFSSNFVFTCQTLVGCCFGDLSWLSSRLSLRETQTDSSNTANKSVKSLNCCMLQGKKWQRKDRQGPEGSVSCCTCSYRHHSSIKTNVILQAVINRNLTVAWGMIGREDESVQRSWPTHRWWQSDWGTAIWTNRWECRGKINK